ncbi:AcrR family transcriptional regulator [Mycobacteroides chelonae]|nr:AcrR family transcriptional regulator [Mycobacteroides chelonae]
MTEVVRPFRGVSANDRRTQRRAALLDASLSMVATRGISETTISAICAQAGLSKKYFYEHFNTRDEVFAVLAERLIEQIIAVAIGSVAGSGVDLLQRMREAIGSVITLLVEDPRNARLFVDVLGSDLLAGTLGCAERRLAGLLIETVLVDVEGTPRERERLNVVALVIVVGTAQAVIDWIDGTIELSRSDLIDEIATMATVAARAIKPNL